MSLAISRQTISSEAALKAVNAGIAYGNENNIKIVIAITDIGGHLMALGRCDGAFAASTTIASDKAYTSAIFGLSTDDLNGAFGDNQVLRDGIGSQDRVALFGGGFPILQGDQLIGGVGASGGSEDEDRACARAALEALGL